MNESDLNLENLKDFYKHGRISHIEFQIKGKKDLGLKLKNCKL